MRIDYQLRFDCKSVGNKKKVNNVNTGIDVLVCDAKGVIEFPAEASSLTIWVNNERHHRTTTT